MIRYHRVRRLVAPDIAVENTIFSDEMQNAHAFGSESMLEGV